MGFIIDSNVFIDAERGWVDVEKHLAGREEEEIFISVISASELLHGVHRAGTASVRNKRSAFVEDLLGKIPVLPIDLQIVRMHAQVWAALSAKGKTTGLHDTWLAASCLAYGHTLVTANLKDFKKIPGLKVENWTQ